MPKKEQTIQEMYKENEKNINELVKQLRLVGVKEKTIKMIMKDIQDYQEKLWKKQMLKAFDNMKKIIRSDEND